MQAPAVMPGELRDAAEVAHTGTGTLGAHKGEAMCLAQRSTHHCEGIALQAHGESLGVVPV